MPRALVEEVCGALGVPVRFATADEAFLVPGQAAAVLVADGSTGGARVGILGQVAPAVAEAEDCRARTRCSSQS